LYKDYAATSQKLTILHNTIYGTKAIRKLNNMKQIIFTHSLETCFPKSYEQKFSSR